MKLENIKRILIIRTDRIGDVVLSTPTITATRKAFPKAYIAVMVSPVTLDIIEGNPNIDEVISYDKHEGLLGDIKFILMLKKKRFDLALILHSTSRINVLSFLAGIPNRVGYERGKLDLLLTKGVTYEKKLGKKHESEYSLDLLESLGVSVKKEPLLVPINKRSEDDIRNLLEKEGVREGERLIILHPGASSYSKMWPKENFAKVGDILAKDLHAKIVLISGPEQVTIGEEVDHLMKEDVVFLCGKTRLDELAPLFKRASLFISNDSGPVHIASSVDCPVIAIFSRNEPGLSPERWMPLNKKSSFIHKDSGCSICLAHECKKDFLCLRSITVEEVVKKSEELLK
ncbi:MAG: lipopolysaccharide heptosyltransferase II [Candidatus Omnitrophota bacterium]